MDENLGLPLAKNQKVVVNRSVQLVTVSVWFHESGFDFPILAVCFGFSKMWLFNLSGFDTDSGFSSEVDLQKNAASLR